MERKQCITSQSTGQTTIDFTGDWDSIINFIDNDPEFMVNLTNVLGLNPDEVNVIDSLKVIYVIEDHGDSFYD